MDLASLPVFRETSIWTTRVDTSNAVLDPVSPQLCARLAGMISDEVDAGYGPSINTTAWSVPVYTVPAGQPLVPVTLEGAAATWNPPLAAMFAAGVPIPPGAVPAKGTDRLMVIWQPDTDTLWEFWVAIQAADGSWSCRWGGKMTDVSENDGYFTGKHPLYLWGAAACSLAMTPGLITPSELDGGVIPHALRVSLPQIRRGQWAAPARRCDGSDISSDSIPEGAHFRIDPAVDLDTLGLEPAALTLARAFQQYGAIVTDKSGVVAFWAQDPTPTGANPYPALFGNVGASKLVASLPWEHVQLLEMALSPTPKYAQHVAPLA